MSAASDEPAAGNLVSADPVVSLRSGRRSTVGILALGGYEADPLRLERARCYFEGRGFSAKVAPDPSRRSERFSASDEVRLAALERFVADPEIGIVVALRGGYGLTRLLSRIDFDAVARSIAAGKKFVGHSDFTAFQLALLRTGAVSYAGPMAGYDFGTDPVVAPISTFTESHFWTMLECGGDTVEFDCGDPGGGRDAPFDGLEAEGRLWGGNLAMVCSLLGTAWMPEIDDGVLFMEDINEHPYRIERSILQLHHAGVLKRQRAILLGDFSGYKLTPYDNGYGLAAAIRYLRSVVGVPILTGLPFGHCRDKLTLPVGGWARISVCREVCTMTLAVNPPKTQAQNRDELR